MATGAHHRWAEQRMVRHGARPYLRRFVAALTVASHTDMDAVTRFSCYSINRSICVVTCGALSSNGDIGMEPTWVPSDIPTAVTCITVSRCRSSTDGLVRNVVGRLAISRWIGARVTGTALVRHTHLGVVPQGGFPGGADVVTRIATGTPNRNMATGLASCVVTVVT